MTRGAALALAIGGAVGVAGGCGGAEPLPADCASVGNGVRKYWADRAREATDPEEQAAIAETSRRAAAKFERHCRDDQWNPDMIACARVVFRLDDSGCMKFLSGAQRARWDQDAGDLAVPGGIGIGIGP